MPLPAGEKLGPYEIRERIGAGGMGEVYRARDARLGRDVAIKVSAQQFSERFEREARAIASLNHPNICTLYDVGPNYLVMELVEGATLAERIKEGMIPLEESLNVVRQIADALDAAHEKGIVHRDLKPGNVKIKPDGVVKVLDFGLAKTGGTPAVQSDNSPTISMAMTEAGMILGTASYMSPEQAKGKVVDKRTDIYAFGLVLYEMLTGKRLHSGENTTEVLASVIKEEPKWDKVPPQVQRLLQTCLEKDPQKRLRHIGDVMRLVDEGGANVDTVTAPSRSRLGLVWIPVAAVVIIAGALFLWQPWRSAPQAQEVRLQIPVPEKLTFNPGTNAVISPDGKWSAFVAVGPDNSAREYVRPLDSLEPRPLEGSEVAAGTAPPFWSYDSRSIVYWANGKLKKSDIAGGPPQIIGDVSSGNQVGGAWNREGTVLFGSNRASIQRVAAAGGTAAPVTVFAPGETAHRFPQFLPDQRHFLYHRTSSKPETTGVYVGSIDIKPDQQSMKPLLVSDRQAYYAPSQSGGNGWLLFIREGSLMAQRFDPDKLTLSGDPAPVAGPVGSYPSANYAFFSVSDTGVLLYRGGSQGAMTELAWLDSHGAPVGRVGAPGPYMLPSLSPDGNRVAVSTGLPGSVAANIWVIDVADGRTSRLTFGPARDENSLWFPDGKRILFSSRRGGARDFYTRASDGTGDDQLLLKSDQDKTPFGFSRDGKYLLYGSNGQIWVLPMEGDLKPFPFLQTQFQEFNAQFSPDARFVAYDSNETGNREVYVRPFSPGAADPSAGGKWMVSQGGGTAPQWRGKQLLYLSATGMMAVDVSTDKTFQRGTPKQLFLAPPTSFQTGFPAITADGQKLLFVEPQGISNAPAPFTVVMNWQASLKK